MLAGSEIVMIRSASQIHTLRYTIAFQDTILLSSVDLAINEIWVNVCTNLSQADKPLDAHNAPPAPLVKDVYERQACTPQSMHGACCAVTDSLPLINDTAGLRGMGPPTQENRNQHKER